MSRIWNKNKHCRIGNTLCFFAPAGDSSVVRQEAGQGSRVSDNYLIRDYSKRHRDLIGRFGDWYKREVQFRSNSFSPTEMMMGDPERKEDGVATLRCIVAVLILIAVFAGG